VKIARKSIGCSRVRLEGGMRWRGCRSINTNCMKSNCNVLTDDGESEGARVS
jgi:hypothetical protein